MVIKLNFNFYALLVPPLFLAKMLEVRWNCPFNVLNIQKFETDFV